MSFTLSKNQPADLDPWAAENLQFDRLQAIGKPIKKKTADNYGPALDSYLDFVIKHHFPVEPNEDTFSFYIVYMDHHVGFTLTQRYLKEVVHQLQPYFPDVRRVRRADIVSRTLQGCARRSLEAFVDLLVESELEGDKAEAEET